MKSSRKPKQQALGMVDVGGKEVTERVAVAESSVCFPPKTFAVFLKEGSPKGNVFEVARVAGVMAAKATPQIVPLCHPLPLDKVEVDFDIDRKQSRVVVTAQVKCRARTGVEMEALAAVSAAALTIYDMMKWADKTIEISGIRLLEKKGGKSGHFQRS